MKWLLMLPVWLYRRVISPLKPPCCRFRPTCSEYALLALRHHGALRGSWLTVRRIVRCQPFAEPGFDPVPGIAQASHHGRAGSAAPPRDHSDERPQPRPR